MPPNYPMSLWGNEKTMNLNTLVLTNIQSSPYFKVRLFELKTYHEVIDEIYYKVSHLEPWEKGSRKTAGQTGMCGGSHGILHKLCLTKVRGVGAGGIVSSAYCLLFKLFTLKLTKKQVIGLINHPDSPYIRGLGFMYIRYTQPPADLWGWFEDYLDDEEEIDVKAGGGHVMTVGEMLRQWLVKLEWYATLFPRIPVPIQKDIAAKLKTRPITYNEPEEQEPQHIEDDQVSFGKAERRRGHQDNSYGNGYRRVGYHGDDYNSREGSREKGYRNGDYGRDRDSYRNGDDKDHKGSRGHSPSYRRSPPHQHGRQSSPHERSSASRRSPPGYSNSFERELARERDRQHQEQGRDRGRSRSRSPWDRRERRSRSWEKGDRHSGSKGRKEKRSRSRDRKERRSRSRDRKERSQSRDRKERSQSRDRKERLRSKDVKERRRSYNAERDYDGQRSSSHKHSHKDKHRDRERREGKSHKHKRRDREH